GRPDIVIPHLAAPIGADYKYVGGVWMLTIRSDEKL
ncbi:MAG: hypothetical protein JWR77_64, partial [Rhizorhabdus sp.]|nr:hypothetical protein [Rhizorhabdus sp.]